MNPDTNSSNRWMAGLMILLSLAILILIFSTIALPHLKEEEQIEFQIEQLEKQTNDLKLLIEQNQIVEESRNELQKEIIALQQNHLTELSQEDVIRLLDELAAETEILLINIGFDQTDTVSGHDGDQDLLLLEELLVSLSLTGTFEESLGFIRTLESQPYDITLTSLNMIPMDTMDNPLIRVGLQLQFFALADTSGPDRRIAHIEPETFVQRENPFVAVTE